MLIKRTFVINRKDCHIGKLSSVGEKTKPGDAVNQKEKRYKENYGANLRGLNHPSQRDPRPNTDADADAGLF